MFDHMHQELPINRPIGALDLSIVIPIYNEADNITPLYDELTAVLETLGRSYEVIVIDDGSTDDSYDRLQAIHEQDTRWQVIRFRRNFGQTAGFAAGFGAARGKVTITIDADLQNDPHDIPRLLDKMAEGYDIVSGWRMDRKEPMLTRRLPSMMANRLISRITGVSLHDYGCSLKAYETAAIKHVRLYGELHRFIPALASEVGVRVAEIPVKDRPRIHGKSKYGINRTFKVMVDLIAVSFFLSYFSRPIYVFGAAGFISGLIGGLIGLYLLILKIFEAKPVTSSPLLSLSILLVMIGVQLISTGLVADMVMRTYHESQQKPIFHVRERLFDELESESLKEPLA